MNNNWKLVKPHSSVNQIKNPSAETTGNFSSVSGATVTRVTTSQKYGVYSYRIESTANGDGIQLTTVTLANATHFLTVRVGGTHPDLQASLSGYTRDLRLLDGIDNTWKLYGVVFPAIAANGATAVDITAKAAGDFNIDGVQIEAQTTWTTYIDGSQKDCQWLGLAHQSSSERSGESRAGGIVQDFYDEYGFFIQHIIGAGSTTVSINVDNYALLPGGEVNRTKINSRIFSISGRFVGATEKELHRNIQKLRKELQQSTYVEDQPFIIRFGGAEVQKEITAFYRSGLEGNLPVFYGDQEATGQNRWGDVKKYTANAVITIFAPDPYWLEIGESAVELDTNDSAVERTVAGRLRSTGQWNMLGPPDVGGSYTTVTASAEDETYVYFGGIFFNFDNIANADYIVRWHKIDQVFSALSTGADNSIFALAIGPDGTLYAGGDFGNIGGVAATNIAQWDGSAWSALGSGMNGRVEAITFGLDGTLYATGAFTTADGGGANRIAAWDGSAWSALGSGIDDTGRALAIGLDGTLFVGGAFLNADGGGANRIAAWDGSAWSALGSGMNALVRALAIGLDGVLYAGGTFTTADGNSANRIAQWNGTAWSALGSGMDDIVRKLSVGLDGILYAGGEFSTAGGITLADSLARWNLYVWAHLDIDLAGAAPIDTILASRFADPVIRQNYDLWIGFQEAGGTATFAGAVTASNEGGVQAFPKIVYSRSGGTTAIIETLRNERTGKELLFNYSLLDGETLTIDLPPAQKNINSTMFGKRLDAVLPNSDFGSWLLLPGNNNITSYINTSGAPTITAFMIWRDRYDGYN